MDTHVVQNYPHIKQKQLQTMFFSALVLLAGSASAFVPPLSLVGLRFRTSHLAATVTPEIHFQSRIAEPTDTGSVGAAAALLSEKFPDEPFVVQYRERTIHDVEVEHRPILDMSVLKQIKIDDNSVTVAAGVSIDVLATNLKAKGSANLKELFYSLPAVASRSVVETIFDSRFSKFHKAVKEVKILNSDGTVSSKQLFDVDSGKEIVVGVTLEPPPREPSEYVARWYVRKDFSTPYPDMFSSDIPEDVKVVVLRAAFNTVNVVVFVDGGRDIGLPKDDWAESLVKTPQELWSLQKNLAQIAGLDELNASGTLDTSKINPTGDDILKLFSNREENLVMWIEKDRIRASFNIDHPPDVDDEVKDSFEFDEKTVTCALEAGDKATFSKHSTKDTSRVVKGTVIPGFTGEAYDGERGKMQSKRKQYATSSYDNMMNPALIIYPNCAQDVSLAIKWATDDTEAGWEARKSNSHPSGAPYKVMGRGGGHQYCGVSCENGALIVSMDRMKKREANDVSLKGVTGPDGKPHDVTKELRIGTGDRLKQFAEFNNKAGKEGPMHPRAKGNNNVYGWTIPHGECPQVGIGGHSQTGGYGHICRAFGLAIDYVYGFEIVLATGEIRTVTRDSTDQQDRDLYWAVLGGSPGAFGITTELIIHPIMDKDYPHSTAYSRAVIHNPKRMEETIKILEDFTNRAQGNEEDSMAPELDLQVTFSSNVENRLIPPLHLNDENSNLLARTGIVNLSVILFELECKDQTNPKARKQMDEIINRFEKHVYNSKKHLDPVGNFLEFTQMGTVYNGKSHYKLSEMSLGFTRKPPFVTEGGRENRKPYRKMTYGSRDKLKEGWASAMTSLLNDVEATPNDISCAFQISIGGGTLQSNGKANLNAIAHRDAICQGVIFDLFRGEAEADMMAAENFQRRFELQVVNKYQSQYPKVMAQWASHGDLDMNKKEVWEKYFDDPDTYYKLRRIKKDLDPDDVFHSRFTVRPAED